MPGSTCCIWESRSPCRPIANSARSRWSRFAESEATIARHSSTFPACARFDPFPNLLPHSGPPKGHLLLSRVPPRNERYIAFVDLSTKLYGAPTGQAYESLEDLRTHSRTKV